MKKKISIAAMLLLPPFFAGCAVPEGGTGQMLGAGGGAAVGALLGQAIGHDTTSTLIGAAVGAAIGWGAVAIMQQNSKPVRSAEQDASVYGLASLPDSPRVKIRQGTSSPKEVRSGGQVTINTDYSLQLPKDAQQTNVVESFTLKKDGKKLTELPPKTLQYGSGGYLSEAVITIPKEAEPGTYVIEHKVQTGTNYDVDESTFIVQG
jgi:hypothetical protein